MKKLLFILFILISNFSFGQPDPAWFYPKKIEKITQQLKSDPDNYELIWQRLDLKVRLLGRESSQFNDPFIYYPNEKTCEKINCKEEYEQDFEKIYDAMFVSKKLLPNPSKFYFNRIDFYAYTLQLDKAYNDLVYLKNNIPIMEEHKSRIEDYFFKIYVLKKDYNNALQTVNAILERENKLYYTYDNPDNKYHDKVALFQYFNKIDELIAFTKQNLMNSFDLYFKSVGKSEWERNRFKNSSYSYLVMLVHYLKKYNHKDLLIYEKLYNQLYYQVSENHRTINPNLSDEELQSIISKI